MNRRTLLARVGSLVALAGLAPALPAQTDDSEPTVLGLTERDLELWAHRQSTDPRSPFYGEPVNEILSAANAE